MSTQLTAPRPLHGWAPPTVAANWTADMLERLSDDGWLYELVEVASPTQYRPDLADKAAHWLTRGVGMVWVVWPERHEVDVWTPGATEPRTLRDDDALEGGEIVPGFRVALDQLW